MSGTRTINNARTETNR